MWISLWNPCAPYVRISLFHAQDFRWAIRRSACRTPRAPRSFSRSVRVPRDAAVTPRRPSRVLRPPADSGGETISDAMGASPPQRGSHRPHPAREIRKDVSSQALRAPRGVGTGLGRRRTEQAASAPRPALPGRSVSAPRTETGRPRGWTREGPSAPTARSQLRPLRGGWRSGEAAEREARWTAQNGRVRGKAGFAKSRAGTGRRRVSPRRDTGRGGQMAAHSPWGSGPSSSRTSDSSCGSGVRPAPEASGGVLPGTRTVLFHGDRAT